MRPYGLRTTLQGDWAEVFISEDAKTIEVKTSPSWRLSAHRYCHTFRVGETTTTAWRSATIHIDQLGPKVTTIHNQISDHHKSAGWLVSYDTNSVRVASSRVLSDETIKSIWLAVLRGLRNKIEMAA